MSMLNDHENKPSMMRTISLICVIVAAALAMNEALLAWNYPERVPSDPTVILYFLGAAFGGKVGQRAVEMRAKPSA